MDSRMRQALMHDVQSSSLFTGDMACRHQERRGGRVTNQARQAHWSSGAGEKAELDLRKSKDRVIRGNPQVTCQRQFEAAPERGPRDGRDRRTGQIGEAISASGDELTVR